MDNQWFKNLKRICRIACNEEEEEKIRQAIEQIIDYASSLDELSGQEVALDQEQRDSMLLREDVVGKLMERKEFLANAAEHVGGMIRVPPVL
jgi:aspartyl-tRNA(Asn)/glutamyl-tRNA(Gln) amidotransferase subunit C